MDIERRHAPRGRGATGVIAAAAYALAGTLVFALASYLLLSGWSSPNQPSDFDARRSGQELAAPSSRLHAVALGGGAATKGSWWGAASDPFATDSPQQSTLTVPSHDFEATRQALPTIQSLPATLGFTFSAWVRLQHVASSWRCLATHGGHDAGRWALVVAPSGTLKLSVQTVSGAAVTFTSILALELDAWTHVAVGYDGEAQRAALFYDGRIVPHAAPLDQPAVSISLLLH